MGNCQIQNPLQDFGIQIELFSSGLNFLNVIQSLYFSIEFKNYFQSNFTLWMERDGNECVPLGNESDPVVQIGIEESVLNSTLFLEHVGEVILTCNSDGLSWKLADSSENDGLSCLGVVIFPKIATEIKFSDVYAVENINYGMIHDSNVQSAGRCLLGQTLEMFRFTVHCVERSKSLWGLTVYTFGHKDLEICQMWGNKINASLNLETGRPKNLMVFVNPKSGKGDGCRTWESVAPIFSRAKVNTKVIVTRRAGQAFEVMASASNKELNSYDGVITVGGDGFFNEILNGFLRSRHKATYPPTPPDFVHSAEYSGSLVVNDLNNRVSTSSPNDEQSPLLSSLKDNGVGPDQADKDEEFSLPNEQFKLGIIPAGSTDAIVMCTTGARDPITSAVHIVLGKRVSLDIAQIVRWKTTSSSKVEPHVRYAASFFGYGFYGDVITESEKYRWMGPRRYDYAGTKVFLRHRSYQAEIAYLEVKTEQTNSNPERGNLVTRKRPFWDTNVSERVVCRVNCSVCSTQPAHISAGNFRLTPYLQPTETKWKRSTGKYLSVGAAIISCRNEKAPDGLVADAHLSDGFLHLILIKDCLHASYLWHLIQLTKKGGNPLNFEFVEHHKTPAFTFTSIGNESLWNLDGELFQAHQLSAQVLRGFVSLFAAGPEV